MGLYFPGSLDLESCRVYFDHWAVLEPLKAGPRVLKAVLRTSKGFIGASNNVSGAITAVLKALRAILRALQAVLGAIKAVLRTMIPASQESQRNQKCQQVWTVVVA